MNYAYLRNNDNSNINTVVSELKALGITDDKIYTSYEELINSINQGDVVIIKSLNDLGNNYEEICNRWKDLTENNQLDVRVLTIPALNTQTDKKETINEILLGILEYVIENNERRKQKNIENVNEGIRKAKELGIHTGRPKFKITTRFIRVVERYKNKEITLKEACRMAEVSKRTFIKYMKELESR